MINQYIPSYVDVISSHYPGLQVQSAGDGDDYTALVATSPSVVPDKAALDALIAADTINRVWEAIKDARDNHTQNGGSRVGNNWFHSDQSSRTQQIALVLLGAGLPPGIMWKTMASTFVVMTPTLAQQIFGAAVQLDQAVFTAAETHHARMAASSTPWSYDFSKGWPLMYEQFAAGITVAP
jgi:Domain of unknown function (DUF4376)